MEKIIKVKGWELVLDSQSGWITRITKENGETVLCQNMPLFTAQVGGISSNNYKSQMYHIIGSEEIGKDTKFEGVEERVNAQGESQVNVRVSCMDWSASTLITFYRNDVQLCWTLENCGSASRKIRWVNFKANLIGAGQFCDYSVIAPGFTPDLSVPYQIGRKIVDYKRKDLITTARGEGLAPLDQSSLAGVYDDERGYGVVTWIDNNDMAVYTTLRKEECGVMRGAEIFCPCELMPSEKIEIKGVFVGSFHRARMDLIRHVCKTQAARGGKGASILQISVGQRLSRTPFHRDDIQTITIITPTRFENYDDVIATLDEIKEQGFEMLSIVPKCPFPGYTAFDLTNVDKTYGSAAGLKALINTAHEKGIRVILEVALRGVHEFDSEFVGMEESPYMQGCDAYFSHHEKGMFARTYLRAFDFASPAFQAHLEGALKGYLKDYGVDGFLLDSELWNDFPNWQPTEGNKPYDSIVAGVKMARSLRESLRKEKPDVFLLTEACGAAGAEGHDAYLSCTMPRWAQWAFSEVISDRGTLAREHNLLTENTLCWQDFAQWYEEARATLPAEFMPIHAMDTYKLVEWTMFLGRQFTTELFGSKAHQVLSGILMMSDGGFMAYDGAQKNSEAVYAELLKARKEENACQGTCSLTAVKANDARVATILWQNGSDWLVFSANLDGVAKSVTISGEAIAEQRLDLSPYEIQLVKGSVNGK